MNRRPRERANHDRRGDGGGETPLKEEEVGKEGREGGEGKHHPGGREEERTTGEAEGIHINVLSSRSKKKRERPHRPKKAEEGSTTQGGGGRQHHGNKEGIAAIGGRHHRPKGGKGEVHSLLFGGAPFLLLLWVGVLISCPPLGGADFPPLPCWVVPFPLKKKKENLEIFLQKGIEISQVN